MESSEEVWTQDEILGEISPGAEEFRVLILPTKAYKVFSSLFALLPIVLQPVVLTVVATVLITADFSLDCTE